MAAGTGEVGRLLWLLDVFVRSGGLLGDGAPAKDGEARAFIDGDSGEARLPGGMQHPRTPACGAWARAWALWMGMGMSIIHGHGHRAGVLCTTLWLPYPAR